MKSLTHAIGILVACVAIAAAVVATGCARQEAARGARASLHVGAPITVAKPVAIADLSANPDRFLGQTVRLEGTVKKVCQGIGCWAEVAAPDGSTFLAKSLDESVLLPNDCAGRRIVVQGKVTTLGPAPGEPNPEGHECPRPDYVVATEGIDLK